MRPIRIRIRIRRRVSESFAVLVPSPDRDLSCRVDDRSGRTQLIGLYVLQSSVRRGRLRRRHDHPYRHAVQPEVLLDRDASVVVLTDQLASFVVNKSCGDAGLPLHLLAYCVVDIDALHGAVGEGLAVIVGRNQVAPRRTQQRIETVVHLAAIVGHDLRQPSRGVVVLEIDVVVGELSVGTAHLNARHPQSDLAGKGSGEGKTIHSFWAAMDFPWRSVGQPLMRDGIAASRRICFGKRWRSRVGVSQSVLVLCSQC